MRMTDSNWQMAYEQWKWSQMFGFHNFLKDWTIQHWERTGHNHHGCVITFWKMDSWCSYEIISEGIHGENALSYCAGKSFVQHHFSRHANLFVIRFTNASFLRFTRHCSDRNCTDVNPTNSAIEFPPFWFSGRQLWIICIDSQARISGFLCKNP